MAHVPDGINYVDFLTNWVKAAKVEASLAFLIGARVRDLHSGEGDVDINAMLVHVMIASIMDAIDTTFDLPFPAALIPATEFLALDELVRHEKLRDRGTLRYRDTMGTLRDKAGKAQNKYIFLSHQWTAWSAPDPSGAQLAVMHAAVRHVAATHGWPLEDVMVWCDYTSIPQSNEACMQQAISSLSAYAACAAAFVIVAPEVAHSDTGSTCSVATYRLPWHSFM